MSDLALRGALLTFIEPSEHWPRCVGCNKPSHGRVWQPGEALLWGQVYACSRECGEAWAREHANEGYRPGEPGWDIDVEGES